MRAEALLGNDIPLIDLRAPVEFAQGAFPTAVNLPLLTDAERQKVGLVYKNLGREAAIEKGQALVSGTVRESRRLAWVDFLGQHGDAWLYCWRGGLRSQTAQSWLREQGLRVPSVQGGYKHLRQACLNVLEAAGDDDKRWLVLAGRTGSGKTRVINKLAGAIDLEGLARHRGSAFGGHPQGQPTPISFENALAIAYLKHDKPTLVLEDESRTIGRLALPGAWFKRMCDTPLVLIEVAMETRVDNIRAEYVDAPLTGGTPAEELRRRLTESLNRIRKRLGGERHREIGLALNEGFRTGNHEGWIELLLKWYYDPMYDYQLASKRRRVVFEGGTAAVTEYLQSR